MSELSLNELDFENVADWPRAVKVTVIIASCVILLMAFGQLVIRGQLTTLRVTVAQELSLRQTYQQMHHQAANLKLYQAQLVDIRQTLKTLLSRLPNKTEIPALLEDISTLGHMNGLKFSLFKPLKEVKHEFYAELPIKIMVTGEFHQLANFVSDISALDRIVNLSDFNLENSEEKNRNLLSNSKMTKVTQDGYLIMELTAVTYRYLEH